MNVATSLQSALRAHQSGDLPRAEQAYRQILRVDPRHVDALHLLGVLAYQTGRHETAVDCITRAIQRNRSQSIFHNNLGAAYRALGRLPEAQDCFQRALKIQPNYPDALNNLASALHAQGRLDEAEQHYRQAIRYQPAFAAAYSNLGNVLKDQGRLADADTSYRNALRYDPNLADACNNLGVLAQDAGRLDDALRLYQQALDINPNYVEALNNAGNAHLDQGDCESARTCFERTHALRPSDAMRLKLALTMPTVVSSLDELHQCRHRYLQELSALDNAKLVIDNPALDVGITPMQLMYHGENDCHPQATLARIYRQATPALTYTAPHCDAPAASAADERRLKIGFISTHFYNHSNTRLFAGLIRHFPRDRFELSVLRFSGHEDDFDRRVRESADRVVTVATQLQVAQKQIAELELDVLFYTDIGMELRTYLLAFARLAPVQCTTWGVPVTSGISTIDYFLSNIDLELPDADTHYTERLVRLSSLPTYYERPSALGSRKTRGELGLDDHAHLYVCPQSLTKLHPDFDGVLRGILRADAAGKVVFITGAQPSWTATYRNRLQQAMPAEMDRVQFLPRQSADDFLQILASADVLLDPIHFGGGNTTYEAFEFGTPIVTLPGRFMRGRVTYACYRQMNVLDCVASDKDDYVRQAVRLATDPVWRAHVRSRILAARHVLYENAATLRDLAQFFTEAVKQQRGWPASLES